jgi:transcriptional regulator with XRE-family HTH domain
MKSLGEHLRTLRISAGLLLREVAAELEIDPSLLSRIERGEKHPTREQVLDLARILRTDREELLAIYFSDRVYYELAGEKVALRAIRIAEERITYARTKRRKRE